MDFQVIDRQSLDLKSWDNLVSRDSFFQTTDWMDVCIDGLAPDAGPENVRAVFLCGFDGKNLVAGMPGVITGRLGLESFYSMLNDTYGGVVYCETCVDEIKEEFVSHITDYFKGKKFSRVVITDYNGNLAFWTDFPMTRKKHFTHIIEFDSNGQYQPHKKVKGDIRAGQRAKSEVVRIENSSQIDAFYNLYQMTEQRHNKKKTLYGKAFFNSILDHLGESRRLYWTGLMAGEKMIGSQIHFIHGDTLVNWQTVSDYEKRHHKPGQLLMYDAVRKGMEIGLTKINLGASPPDADGLIFYKERWGGVRVEYDILTYRSGLRRLLRR
jgi:hypothetical protein